MQIIDTHAHIYLPEFDGDRAQVIEAAAKEGVSAILLPAIDSSTHGAMLQAEKDFSGCRAMIGLHHCSVKEEYERELDIVNYILKQGSFVAIGEIGLDFYWDKTYVQQQYDAFHRQV